MKKKNRYKYHKMGDYSDFFATKLLKMRIQSVIKCKIKFKKIQKNFLHKKSAFIRYYESSK